MSLRTKGDRYGKKKHAKYPFKDKKWQNSFKHEKEFVAKVFTWKKKKAKAKDCFQLTKIKFVTKYPFQILEK